MRFIKLERSTNLSFRPKRSEVEKPAFLSFAAANIPKRIFLRPKALLPVVHQQRPLWLHHVPLHAHPDRARARARSPGQSHDACVDTPAHMYSLLDRPSDRRSKLPAPQPCPSFPTCDTGSTGCSGPPDHPDRSPATCHTPLAPVRTYVAGSS